MSRITGILKDGMGKPIVNCKIMLKALRTSTTVIVHTVASQNPNEAGLYDMTVESGQYRVMLCADGYPPEYVGDIQVYKDSPSGTLNYFLGLPQDDDLRPDAIKHFEAMVAKVSSQAIEVENSKKNVESSAASALTSQNAAKASEQSASSSAAAALASQNAAKAAEQATASSSQAAQASQQSAHSSESAAAGSAAAALASQNAAKASEQAAASSAQAAQASQQSAHISESAAAGSAAAALASQNAAKASEQEASSSAATAANDAATKAAAATEAKLKEAVRIDADRAAASASESNASALQAGNFASSARDSQTAAAQAATQASGSASVSVSNANAAKTSETAAAGSASSAAQSALQASGSASTAASSASAAKASETAAAGSAQNAKAEADRTVGLLSTKQDKSPLLSAIAGLLTGANKLPYFTGNYTADQTDLTQVGRDIIGKATVDAVLKYLQLGEVAKLNVGTTTGTVAAGDDLRISGALQKNNNLSDLQNKATARANLGLGSSAVAGIGSLAGNVAPGNVTFGISQTWKNVSSQREYGVLYTNSSTRPIVICLRVEIPASTTITLEVDNITTDGFNSTSGYSQEGFLFSIVPPGVAYRALRIRGSSQNILSWVELS